MNTRRGPRPEFKAGQVAILEMNGCGDSHVAFASAPEENEFEFLIKHNPASPTAVSQHEHLLRRKQRPRRSRPTQPPFKSGR